MTLSPAQLDEILERALAVAGQAGDLLLEGLNKPKEIVHKGQVDLVTQYDRAAEKLICETLSSSFPDIGILAEEGGQKGNIDGSAMWIVDPLDGTTNFSAGHPVFAVSIGLQDEGSQVLGVIGMPALGMTVWARAGGGAFCNGEPISVTQTRDLDKSLVATGFPYDRRTVDDDNTREYRAFMKSALGVRRCGAAAVDMAFVARGVYDGFWEPRLQPWDLAAGTAIIREARGRVTDYSGEDLDVHQGWVVASNGMIHSSMLAVIERTRKTGTH